MNWDSSIVVSALLILWENYKLGSLQRHKLGKRSYKSANGDFSEILPKFSFASGIEKKRDKFFLPLSNWGERKHFMKNGSSRLWSWDGVWNKLLWGVKHKFPRRSLHQEVTYLTHPLSFLSFYPCHQVKSELMECLPSGPSVKITSNKL